MGWSAFSPIGYILAATIPSSTNEPQTQIVGTDVQASWNEPTDTGGQNVAVISYLVEIQLSDSLFVTFCTTNTVTCLVPMQSLL